MNKRYSEGQIIKAIKQYEAGAKVDDICRELGISNGPSECAHLSRQREETASMSDCRSGLLGWCDQIGREGGGPLLAGTVS